ncbi:hypothetical protein [Novosphingobium sp. AP12]|uniref:hypothetical protein n=1 Tax=Novosphingobium sp. AP12 TaxID=1144305 RepID=UPI0012FBC200|nr:hypothetical protein [Novosphingobium sp. AP12]
MVNGQNYYTAITRARFGAKLWTEDRDRLVEKLLRRPGEKTSAIEGLGRLSRDSVQAREERHRERFEILREQQMRDRAMGEEPIGAGGSHAPPDLQNNLTHRLAGRAQSTAKLVDRWLIAIVERHRGDDCPPVGEPGPLPAPQDRREREIHMAEHKGSSHER